MCTLPVLKKFKQINQCFNKVFKQCVVFQRIIIQIKYFQSANVLER